MAIEKSFVALPFDCPTGGTITADMISEFIGKTVCVAWVKDQNQLRNNFEPQISVQGTLEGFAGTGKFRVLLNDDSYSYFYDDSVWMIGYDGAKLITDKQRPVIFIN
jgi:hypothetical protein|tara:strand:- start:312 stop:632 length:321 start_codon:yes stop_codon:yes gene_type:complete